MIDRNELDIERLTSFRKIKGYREVRYDRAKKNGVLQ